MGEVVELHDQLVHLADNQEFIADCCRFAENILTEAAVRKKYRLAESTWEALGNDDILVRACLRHEARNNRICGDRKQL
jgi:hypothetical protein